MSNETIYAAYVLSVVNQMAHAGHINDKGVAVEACQAIRAALASPQPPAPTQAVEGLTEASRDGHERPRAWRDVLTERRRQISEEGWTPEHDDQYSNGQLALAASCYCGTGPIPQGHMYLSIPGSWPWDLDWWKPRDYRRNLVRAGALILAEIERLDRA